MSVWGHLGAGAKFTRPISRKVPADKVSSLESVLRL